MPRAADDKGDADAEQRKCGHGRLLRHKENNEHTREYLEEMTGTGDTLGYHTR